MDKIAIIGGGAAGMMASIFAARRGAEVHVYEKNEKTVTVRFRQSSGLEQKTMKLEDFIAYVHEKTESHFIGI